MPYLSFAVVCLLFGSNFFLMDRAGVAFGPLEIGAWRVGGAAAVMLLIGLLTSINWGVRRRDLPPLLFVGLVSNAYPYAVMPWIISRGVPHSYLAMFVAYTPLLTILLSIPLLGVKPTVRQVVGVLGGLGMLALVMLDGQRRDINPWLLLLAITVPTAYCLGNITIRKRLSHVSGVSVTAVISVFAAAALVPLAVGMPGLGAAAGGGEIEPGARYAAWAAVLWMGVIGTGLINFLFIRMVQQQGPLFAGMVTYVVPLVGLFWGAVDSQKITGLQVAAIAGVLAMVALVQYRSAAPEKDADPKRAT